MNDRALCQAHQLRTGPDGLCVLCKRVSRPPLAPQDSVSPQASTRVGIAMTVVVAAALAGIGYAAFASRWQGLAMTAEQPPVPAPGAQVQPEPDPELARIAQADFWKPQPTTIVSSTSVSAGQTAPITVEPSAPSFEGSLPSSEAVAEAERDRLRHEAIAGALAQQALEHAQSVERAAIEEAKGKVRIEMYGADWCPNCRTAQAYLRAEKIPYTEHDIDRDRSARETAHRLNPRRSIPVFRMDNDVVVGFGERSFEAARENAARKRLGMQL